MRRRQALFFFKKVKEQMGNYSSPLVQSTLLFCIVSFARSECPEELVMTWEKERTKAGSFDWIMLYSSGEKDRPRIPS